MRGFIRILGLNGKEALINISHIRCILPCKDLRGDEVRAIIFGDCDDDYIQTEKSLKELEELIMEASK